MVIAVGLSSYNIALFHLVNHAFYKGLLFLGAGAVIHAVADNQDFRKYGGLRPFLPLTYSVMLIASLSLVAFPFMTGFYSKDFILESAYGQFYFSGTVVYFIATIGAMFTTLYSVKVLYLTFLTNPNGPVVNYKHAHEGDIFMSLPLIILAVFSIFFGYITKDIFIGLGSGFFADNSLFIHPTHEIMLDTEFAVPTLFKLLPLVFTISLSVLAIVISEFLGKILINFKFSRLGYNIFGFFNQRFLIELFYNKYITGVVLILGGQTTKVIDKGSVELLGPFGLEKGLINLSRNIASLDTGVITSYALYILIGLIFYMLIPYLSLFDNSLLLLILLSLFSIIRNDLQDVNALNTNNQNINTNILRSDISHILNTDLIVPITNGICNIYDTVINSSNIEFKNKMEWLANNYSYIIKMNKLALDLLINDIKPDVSLNQIINIKVISLNNINTYTTKSIFIFAKYFNSVPNSLAILYYINSHKYLIALPLFILLNVFIDNISNCVCYLHDFYSNSNISKITKKILNLTLDKNNVFIYLVSLAIRFWEVFLEFMVIILTALLKLGLLGVKILKILISFIIRYFITLLFNYLNKIKSFNYILNYISNLKVKAISNLYLYLPLDAFSYIKKNPIFMKRAIVYIFNNIKIYNIYISLINIITYSYNNKRELFSYKFYLNEYLNFVHYLNFCSNNKTLINFYDYKKYIGLLLDVSKLTKNYNETMRLKSEILDRLIRLTSTEHLYVCGHGYSGNPDILLVLEVSRHLIVQRGLPNIERVARIIASLHTAMTRGELPEYLNPGDTNIRQVELELSSINPEYVQTWFPLRVRHINLLRIWTRDAFRQTSHNPNDYVRIHIYYDGTVRFIYFYH